jgi:protein TonB
MPPSSRRIIDTESGGRPLAAWLAGLATAMLALGCFGALQPLLPPLPEVPAAADETVPISDFQPPDDAAPADAAEETPPEADVEIPPVPEITPPLTPPEVPELLPADSPPPPLPPKIKPPEPKPKPAARPEPKPMAHRTAPGSTTSQANGTGSSSAPTLFSGGGTGNFPKGSYPAAARSMRQQGTVRLLVTVEESGLPSSVEVQTSSGFGSLDSGALDQIRRHWRWSAGPIRHYIVPFRFELH